MACSAAALTSLFEWVVFNDVSMSSISLELAISCPLKRFVCGAMVQNFSACHVPCNSTQKGLCSKCMSMMNIKPAL